MENGCGVGGLCKVSVSSRKPFLHPQRGSGDAHKLGQSELSWQSAQKVLVPPETPSLCLQSAPGALFHTKPPLLVLFLRNITLGGHPRAASPGITRSQREKRQEPVATRAFAKPNLLTSKGQHHVPSKAAGNKRAPQQLPALTSTKTSSRSATSAATLCHPPESPGDADPQAGGPGRSASRLGSPAVHAPACSGCCSSCTFPGDGGKGTHTHWNLAGI